MLKENKLGIAIRLYDNHKFGTTYGKGLYRKAIYNGTIDVKNPEAKYLIDLYPSNDWKNLARTDGQMTILHEYTEIHPNDLCSWLYHYDIVTKQKRLIDGFCRIDLESLQVDVLICDTPMDILCSTKLQAKPCKMGSADKRTPQLLATNEDLGNW